jgi:hypothetical protein
MRMELSYRKEGKVAVLVFGSAQSSFMQRTLDGVPRKVLNFSVQVFIPDAPDAQYGAAVRAGLAHALLQKYDYVIKLDGDGRHDPQLVSTIIKILARGGVGLVTTSRYLRKSDRHAQPQVREELEDSMLSAAVNRVLKTDFTDVTSNYFGISSELLQQLSLTTEGEGLELELILKAALAHKANVLEIPHPLISNTHAYDKARLETHISVLTDTLKNLNRSLS